MRFRRILAWLLAGVTVIVLIVLLHALAQESGSVPATLPPAKRSTVSRPAPLPFHVTSVVNVSASAPPTDEPNAQFTGFYFLPSGQDGWVVGKACTTAQNPSCSGFIDVSTDGGASWVRQYSGPVALQHVQFVDITHGWAWGREGSGCPQGQCKWALLATTNGGQSWSRVPGAAGIQPLDFISPAIGWGALSTCSPTNGGPQTCSNNELLSTSNGGATWQVRRKTRYPVLAVTFRGLDGWAVESGQTGNRPQTYVLITSDGGGIWSRRGTVPVQWVPPATQATIRFINAASGWLTLFSLESCAMHGCSVSSVYRTLDGGRTWQQEHVPFSPYPPGTTAPCGPAGPPLLAAAVGRVVVAREVPLATCQPPATTLSVSTDGGSTWQQAFHWTEFYLVGLQWTGSQTGWALGADALLYTADGGHTWVQKLPGPSPTRALDFTSPRLGWGMGTATDPGTLLATNNGGASWTAKVSFPGASLTSLSFPGGGNGWVAVESLPSQTWTIWRTRNGGDTWKPIYRPSQPVLGMKFFSRNDGLMILSGCTNPWSGAGGCAPVTLLASQDGGRKWRRFQDLPTMAFLENLRFATSLQAWAVDLARSSPGLSSFNKLMITKDAGRHWTTVTQVPGTGLGPISASTGWMFDPNRFPGRIFQTTDGGQTWTKFILPARMGTPTALDFLNARNGWMVTGGGMGGFRAPALWQTTDGGYTWRLRS